MTERGHNLSGRRSLAKVSSHETLHRSRRPVESRICGEVRSEILKKWV